MSAVPTRWLELSVRTASGEAEALLADALVAVGGRAVEEVDGWHRTHLEEPADLPTFVTDVSATLQRLVGAPVEVRTGWRLHEDWAETWKRGLEPRRITERLVVTPSWHEVELEPGDLLIVVDPGMAFGNAEHGTTRGCLRLLDRVVREGHRILDVGAGSGILAIAAAMLGAAEVFALEGDALAADALSENVERNGVTDRVSWAIEWADSARLEALGPRDGIVANIESGILRPLMGGFAAALTEGGWLILSGVLDVEWEGIRADTERAGFRFEAVDADGEWRAGLFRRSAAPAITA